MFSKQQLLAVVLALILVGFGIGCARSDSSGNDLEEIRALQDEGLHKEAVEELRQILSTRPNDAEASLRLGASLLALGRSGEAIFPLRAASRSDEFGFEARLMLANTLALTDNHASALVELNQLALEAPDNQVILMLRANSALAVNDLTAVLDSADQILALEPGEPQRLTAISLKARAWAKNEATRDQAEQTYRDLEKADWGDDGTSSARMCIAIAQMFAEEHEDAKRASAEALRCAEDYVDTPNIAVAVARVLDKVDLREQGTELLRRVIEDDPGNAFLKAELANRLVAAGGFAEAERLVLAEAEANPSPGSWRTVASIRRRMDKLEPSLEALDKGVALAEAIEGNEETKQAQIEDLNAARADVLIDLQRLDQAEPIVETLTSDLLRDVLFARILQLRGQTQEALDLYESVLERWPNNYAVRAHAARAAYKLGQDERALSELREVIRHNRDETDAPLDMAKIHFGLGQFELAGQFARMQISSRGTTSHEAHAIAAQSLAAQGKVKAALATLQDLAKQQDGRFEPQAIALMTSILELQQSPEEALSVLDRWLETPREGAQFDFLKSRQLELTRLVHGLEAARKAAAEATAREPESLNLAGTRAQFELEAGNVDGAEALARAALRKDDQSATSHAALGLVERARGRLEASVVEFDKAAELNSAGGQYAYLAAQSLLAGGNLDDARARLEGLVRSFPTHFAAANDLAWILATQGENLEQAEVLAQRAVRLQGGAETLHTLGFVQLQQGSFAPATKSLRRALALNPEHGTARYHLALALSGMNDSRNAIEELERALALPGAFPEREAAEHELAKLSSGAEAR